MLPLTLAYTAAVYFIFRGRVTDADGYGGELPALGHLAARLPADHPTSPAARLVDAAASAVAIVNIVRAVFRRRR